MRNIRLCLCLLVAGLSDRAFGDEGMWLYTAPPIKQLKDKYSFEPSKQWLEHLQKSSIARRPFGCQRGGPARLGR
jgi:hypothetical protein